MNPVQYFFPSNKLAAALKRAPPRTVAECLRQADENLRQIAEACGEHVDRGVELLEALLVRWPAKPDPEHLSQVYDASLRLIGVASVAHLEHLDQAAKSLCDVVDGLMHRELWESEPVAVHVQAMRLLRHPGQLGGGEATIMEGLAKVRKRFAIPPPPPKPKPEAAG